MKFSKITGCFYPEYIQYSELPTDLIAITDDDYCAAMNRAAGETLDVQGGNLIIVPARVRTAEQAFSDVKNIAIAQINSAAQFDLLKITNAYPPLEIQTWDQQYAEAVSYIADSKAPTPILAAIVAAYPGQTLAAQAASVISKSAAYKAASGAIVGKRQALTDRVKAAATVADVHLIQW